MQGSLHGLLLAAARRGPQAPAISWKGEVWSYERLVTEVEARAAQWYAAGLRPGDRIALAQPRGPASIAALYAASWLGCPYAPIDTTWPAERIARAIETLDAKAWACPIALRRSLAKSAPNWTPPAVLLEDGGAGPLPDPANGGHQTAYVLFTSGSTGRPKGVVHSHDSALAFVRWAVAETALTGADRLGGHASLAFDLSTFDVFAAAAAGAALCPVPEAIRFRGLLLANFMRDERLTIWYSVPAVWPAVLDALQPQESLALETVLFAGEVFPVAQLQRLRRAAPAARLLNLYGPTETNVVTWHEVGAPDLVDDGAFPVIGRGCPGVSLRVLDEAGGEVDDGALIVDGPTMMTGYLGEAVHVGPYHTGDRVHRTPEDTLRFCGRLDRQIKIRGHRVELAEIEVAGAGASGVSEAVAVPQVREGRVTGLVLFVTPAEVDPTLVFTRCRELLPAAAIPGEVVPLAEMPRTSNGKIDRQRLATSLPDSC